MKPRHLLFLLAVPVAGHGQSAHQLWFDEPAAAFEETLVLGNGTVGAAVYGGTDHDSIHLNHATLWSGEPVDRDDNPDAHLALPAIRAALAAEDYRLADSLQRRLQGRFSQSYAPLGTLHLRFGADEKRTSPDPSPPDDYRRTLELDRAAATTTFTRQGVGYTREYFVSHPHQILVIRLTADRPGALHCRLTVESQLPTTVAADTPDLHATGYAPYHAEPQYRGDLPDAVRFDPARGTRFSARLRIAETDGTVIATNRGLQLSDASRATILVALGTSFNGFDKDPAREGKDHAAITAAILQAIDTTRYEDLLTDHLADHRRYYRRVELDLGPTAAPDLPTDDRLRRYGSGAEDKKLEALYLHYGRYLLLTSSRTPGAPANLQGIWNPYLRPPWSSNYTININAQENYWPAETGNLAEMHEPFLGFIENVAETGAHTARNYYGTRGWVAAHNTDIWAMSNPVGDYGQGSPRWANWNMGGVWLSTHLWEHYLFSRDETFLRERAYPVLKGAARFCLDWLTEGPNGELLTAPSTSPEAGYLTDDGYKGATLYGAAADIAFLRENFQQTKSAATLLGVDRSLVAEIEAAEARLLDYRIGADSSLQEWYHDWADEDPKHRHQTHLFGLHPGHHITPDGTPRLAEASRRALEIKGDETTGWSKGWRINLWARLWDGDRAYKMLRELLRYVEPTGITGNMKGGGTYPNLFDAHPPFQIDGNFGGAAAILEMIVQSSPEEIHLLPALPTAWPEGRLTGVRTRTGHTVDLTWADGKVTSLIIRARSAGAVTVTEGQRSERISLQAGTPTPVHW